MCLCDTLKAALPLPDNTDCCYTSLKPRQCDLKRLVNYLRGMGPSQSDTCINPYLLTPWIRVLLEKLTGFAANQEIPRILWNPKVHYRTHKRPRINPLAPEFSLKF